MALRLAIQRLWLGAFGPDGDGGDGVSIISRETSELSGKDAQFRSIQDSELCLTLHAAEVHADPATVVVTVRSGGSPLAGADVLALFPNNTWKRSRTDTDGEARLDLHSVHLPMTVFVAREGYAAHVERRWLPMERALAVELAPKVGGGSVVFAESTGHVPALAGRLNPILDTSHRTYKGARPSIMTVNHSPTRSGLWRASRRRPPRQDGPG